MCRRRINRALEEQSSRASQERRVKRLLLSGEHTLQETASRIASSAARSALPPAACALASSPLLLPSAQVHSRLRHHHQLASSCSLLLSWRCAIVCMHEGRGRIHWRVLRKGLVEG